MKPRFDKWQRKFWHVTTETVRRRVAAEMRGALKLATHLHLASFRFMKITRGISFMKEIYK